MPTTAPLMGLDGRLRRLGDAEVGDDRVAVLVDQDVRRLDVPVNHPAAVRIGERRSDLIEDRADDGQRQRPRPPDHLLQRCATHVAHDEEVQPLGVPHRIDRNDVGMVQLSDGDRLVPEAVDHALPQQQARRDQLDRHLAVERDLVGQEHGRHPASAELPPDLELPQRGAPQALDHLGPGGLRGVRVQRERIRWVDGIARLAAGRAGEIGGQARGAALGAGEQLGSALRAVAVLGAERAAAMGTCEGHSHRAAG